MRGYPLYDPPTGDRALAELTKAEAKEHFAWFVRQGPERLRLLLSEAERDGVPLAKLDFSRESLRPFWQWLRTRMETAPLKGEFAEERLASLPEWFPDKEGTLQELTFPSLARTLDAGFYMAEVLRQRHPDVHWSLWTKKTGPFHKPYLAGFRLPLVPSDLVRASAWQAIRGEDHPDVLIELLDRWETYRLPD